MHWFTIAFIGIAANLDNLGIGVTFGARSTRVPPLSNLLIALLSMASIYLAMAAGGALAVYFPALWGNLLGGGILVLIGALAIRSSLPAKEGPSRENGLRQADLEAAARADKDGNRQISWNESLSLGLALSVNCLASGFGAGFSGASPLLCSLSVGLFSFLSIDIGIRLGARIARSWLGRYSALIGCVLLIVIGIYEMIV
ncbi:manganese efflux pump [Gorillibacterium sp. sgz500922]|uniref:manganese efflux pump n=1 Tax=Gorillibacterium sp. sgz500922 TaxID=3446694 RepID=UPI003F666171